MDYALSKTIFLPLSLALAEARVDEPLQPARIAPKLRLVTAEFEYFNARRGVRAEVHHVAKIHRRVGLRSVARNGLAYQRWHGGRAGRSEFFYKCGRVGGRLQGSDKSGANSMQATAAMKT